MKDAASRPMPSTTCSMVSVAGAQLSTAFHTICDALKLMRAASRATPCGTQNRQSVGFATHAAPA